MQGDKAGPPLQSVESRVGELKTLNGLKRLNGLTRRRTGLSDVRWKVLGSPGKLAMATTCPSTRCRRQWVSPEWLTCRGGYTRHTDRWRTSGQSKLT
jgi:hypothetical protein